MIGRKRKNTGKVQVDLTHLLEKGGYTGTAQDLKNEIDNLSSQIEANTITEVDLVELKKIAKGERFSIKYTDGTMTSAKYNELLEAVRHKQVEEISVNTDGLEGYRLNFDIYKYFSIFSSYGKIKDFKETNIEKYNDYSQSGFYLDIFLKEGDKLFKRYDYSLLEGKKIVSPKDKLGTILPSYGNSYYIRILKYGPFKDYSFLVRMSRYSHIEPILYNQNEFIIEEDFDFMGSSPEIYSNGGFLSFGFYKKTTLTNLFVNDKPYLYAERFGLKSSLLTFIKRKNISYDEYYTSVGQSIYSVDLENVDLQNDEFQVMLNTSDKLKGYYKIQLINTETQEVVFEKDNREDNTDIITLQNIQMPKLLTIKLWTNESLMS